MKLLPRLLPGLLALLLSLPVAAFEGRVHFNMKSGRDTHPIVYALKGDMARFEMPQAGGATGIIDGKKQEIMMLMPEQKMYMVMSAGTAADIAKKSSKSEVEFEDTGETETILGRECRKYRVTDRNGTTEIWGAEGMGTFMAQMGGGKGMRKGEMPAWQKELAAQGFFPLRVVGKDRKGRESFRMEATKIEEQKLADALFEVPAGYQRFDMGGLMRGLIPGAK